jgi:hypothetical protein
MMDVFERTEIPGERAKHLSFLSWLPVFKELQINKCPK